MLRRRGDKSDAEIRDALLADLERSIQRTGYADRFGKAEADRLLRSYRESIDGALNRPPSGNPAIRSEPPDRSSP